MNPPLQKLTKVLELETTQGFDDRAVIGGLEPFVHRWRMEAIGQVGPDVIERVASALSGYSTLPPADRSARIQSALMATGAASARAQPPRVAAAGSRGRPAAKKPRIRKSTPRADPETRGGPCAADDPALDLPLSHLKGLGDKTIEPLTRLGLATIRDLLLHAPARYEDFRAQPLLKDLEPDSEVSVVGTVTSAATRQLGSRRSLLSVGITDGTGRMTLRFFNQPYLEKQFARGRPIVASGRVQQWSERFYFDNPTWEPLGDDSAPRSRLYPVYPLTAGVSQRWLRNRIRRTVDRYADALGEPLTARTLAAEGLLTRPDAVRLLHAPHTPEDAEAARRRLAIDELLAVQLWTRRRRHLSASNGACDLSSGLAALEVYKSGLPFALTGAQERALDSVAQDVCRAIPMSRLVQGDVGSGKTAVAAGAAAMAVEAGYQVAIMAPTEILADQHFLSFQSLLAPLGFAAEAEPGAVSTEVVSGPANRQPSRANQRRTIARLVGSMPAARKNAVRAAAARGDVSILIGTHAVIQDSVSFPNLALAVVDEQHRFGVMQRADLALRGSSGDPCHQLVMTATPIPRTLALALNADMDHTVIDELPPGRRPVDTQWLGPADRARAYQFIRDRVEQGEQAFVVCPLVTASDSVDAPAAEDEYERLTNVFGELRVGLIHGRMPASEKERTMTSFRDAELDILVATTVIEVGVDVPNATVLLVEGADRFGLAQLHQLRGRIGRGAVGGTCLLAADEAGPTAAKRLKAMVGTSSGMELAELDLQLRGPGDYFGLRQAGVADSFRFARDVSIDVVAQSGRIASAVAERDPLLEATEHEALARRVAEFDAAVARV